MIFFILRAIYTREYTLTPDQAFNLKAAILLELLLELVIVASAIVLILE